MSAFKNYKHFRSPRQSPLFLFPHVCLSCRKSFKKPHSATTCRCPQCAAELTMLGRKFKAPKARDLEQWAKVRLLVEYGFLFHTVYETTAFGAVSVPYPETLEEARQFVKGRTPQRAPCIEGK